MHHVGPRCSSRSQLPFRRFVGLIFGTVVAVIALSTTNADGTLECITDGAQSDGSQVGTFITHGSTYQSGFTGRETEIVGWTHESLAYTPIIIPTGTSQVINLTSAADGVLFDIDADGVEEKAAWTKAGSEVAFLAIDRDGDGFITSGKELFGSHTLPDARNGFTALLLMNLQTNGNTHRGSVSSDDPLFAKLFLWTDTLLSKLALAE